MVCFRQWRMATLGFRPRRTVVDAELKNENYSDVLQMGNCCVVGTENDSGTL